MIKGGKQSQNENQNKSNLKKQGKSLVSIPNYVNLLLGLLKPRCEITSSRAAMSHLCAAGHQWGPAEHFPAEGCCLSPAEPTLCRTAHILVGKITLRDKDYLFNNSKN
jgi:hypothetical protein